MNISKPSGFQSQNGDSGSGGGFGGSKGGFGGNRDDNDKPKSGFGGGNKGGFGGGKSSYKNKNKKPIGFPFYHTWSKAM